MKLADFTETLRDPSHDAAGQFHRNAGDTEREAALAQRGRSGTGRRRVLDALAESPGTDEELHFRLGMRLYTVAPRRNELLRDGWIMDSEERRPTTTGSKAIVWMLTPQGRDQWESGE